IQTESHGFALPENLVLPQEPVFDFLHGFSGGLLHLPTCQCEGVSSHVSHHLSFAGLRGEPLPVPDISVPGTPSPAASIGGLQTNRPSPATAPDRSPVLGVAVTPLDRLASRPHLCPTPHDPCLATATLSRPLERLEPATHARSSGDCQGGP